MVTKATSAMNIVWIQPDGPNTAMQMIPCAAIDSISKSYGSIESTYCWDPTVGAYEKTGIRRGTPDEITFSLEELAGLTASHLQKAIRKAECPIPFYVGTYECAPRTTFSGYDRMKVIEDARIETETENNLALRDSQEDMMDTFDWNAQDVVLSFQLLAFSRETTETETLRDIAICGDPACYGTCGPEADICHTLVAVAEAAAAATANVQASTDGGATWAATATDPFAADEHISSIVCFPMDQTVWRWVVARGTTDAANPAEIAYSDDSGATWTAVNVGSTNGELVPHCGGLFALDRYHMWCVTDAGNVFFSDDAGLTWTDQGINTTRDLNYVFFLDENRGCVVGGDGVGNVLGTTTNGGTTWSVTTTIGGAATDIPWCVTMHDMSTFFIGDDQGELWYSVDGGTTWTQRTIQAPTGMASWDNVFDIISLSRYFMFLCGEVQDASTNPFGVIGRTVNGGTDWELWTTVQCNAASDGLQAVVACHQNRAVSVGGPETTPLAMIYEVTD